MLEPEDDVVPKAFTGTVISWKEGRDVTVEEQKRRVKAPKVGEAGGRAGALGMGCQRGPSRTGRSGGKTSTNSDIMRLSLWQPITSRCLRVASAFQGDKSKPAFVVEKVPCDSLFTIFDPPKVRRD